MVLLDSHLIEISLEPVDPQWKLCGSTKDMWMGHSEGQVSDLCGVIHQEEETVTLVAKHIRSAIPTVGSEGECLHGLTGAACCYNSRTRGQSIQPENFLKP